MTLKSNEPILEQILWQQGFQRYERVGGLANREQRRVVYLSKKVWPQVDLEKSKLSDKALPAILARLNGFVEGNSVTVSLPSTGVGSGELKGLKGYQERLFELRFTEAAPQFRMLGSFCALDVFLGCELLERSKLEGDWLSHCKGAQVKLSRLGNPPIQMLTYDDMNEVLTNWKYAR